MRLRVVIDDNLIKSALNVSGLKTPKEAIEEELKLLVQLKDQEKIRQIRGKLSWTGSLEEKRLD